MGRARGRITSARRTAWRHGAITAAVTLVAALATTAPAGAVTGPSAPKLLTVAAGPDVGTMTVRWSAPQLNGGALVTGYEYRVAIDNGVFGPATYLAAATIRHAPVPCAAPAAAGHGCTYQVRATNGMPGAWSIAVGANWVAPTAPVLGSAAAGPGVGQATLQWRPSKKSGGLPVEYAYQVDTGAGWSAPIVIAPAAIGTIGTLPRVRLTAVVDCPVVSGAGNPCSYMLVASNGAGSSPVSKVKSSKLRRPDPATGLSVYTSSVALGTGVATQALSWTLPENLGGLPITRETVWRCSTSTGSACANSSPGWTTVADLLDQPPPTDTTATCPPNGTCAYEVWVRNAAGRSATWARTVPATPILLAATPDPVVPHQVDLQWLNPVEAGTGTGSVVLFECDGTQDCSSGTWTNVPADAAPWNRVDLGVTAASSYTCTPSVTCTFRVGYVDASGNIGGVSNAVTVLVAP